MSICDEGWPERKLGESCPCLDWAGYDRAERYCTFGLWAEESKDWQIDMTQVLKKPPNNCPFAPILKLLASAKEVKSDLDMGVGDMMNPDWERVEFWTRR